jgi:hypothetical protein
VGRPVAFWGTRSGSSPVRFFMVKLSYWLG